MAALVISISSDISVESVRSSFPRVILIGSISVEVSVAPEVGAAAVASPAGVLELDTHSSSEADPSKSSLPPVFVAPWFHPFCRSIPPIPPAPPAIVAPSTDIISPVDAPPGIHRRRAILIRPGVTCGSPNWRVARLCNLIIHNYTEKVDESVANTIKEQLSERVITPLFTNNNVVLSPEKNAYDVIDALVPGDNVQLLAVMYHDLCWLGVENHSSSDHSSADHSPADQTSGHSTSDQSLSRRSSPSLPLDMRPRLWLQSPLLSTHFSSTAESSPSDSPAITSDRHSHSPSNSAGPSRKRCRDSISPEDNVEEDIEADVLADIEADTMTVEVAADMEVEAGIDAGIGMEVDVRVDIKDEDEG
ncbi:hypothetical protein Tco_1187526 [Tanacetum coccineum]